MSTTTILLIGFSDTHTELLGTLKAGNHRLFGYCAPANKSSNTAIADKYGIELHDTPGPWLKDVDVIVPLVSLRDPEEQSTIMQDYQRLDRALQELRATPEAGAETGDNPPCWIETISPDNTSPELLSVYDLLGAAHGKIHNLYQAFSLQPEPLISADQHYRAILHNGKNQSEPWFLELLASQVAILAGCSYALANHGANFKKLLGDELLGQAMLEAVRTSDLEHVELFNKKQSAFLKFSEKLSIRPNHMKQSDITPLRKAGASDTEILEAVQAIACFSYWVRFINALGVNLGNETIGRQYN